MSIKSIAAKLFAQNLYENTATLTLLQVKSCFAGLIKDAKTTEFGIDHHYHKTLKILRNRFQSGLRRLKTLC
jgi:hypothetical protein